MKRNFSDYWESVEPWAIKTTLFVYILLKVSTEIFNVAFLDNFMESAEPIFLGGLVLTIFLFIEKKLNYKNELETIFNFHSDLPRFFKNKKHKEIKIFALNGHYYFELLKDNKIQTDKLRLLVRKPDRNSILYPKNNKDKITFDSMMKNEIENFKSLMNENYIKQLEINYYNFDSLLHFMIVDNKWMHFGLLKPIDGIPGSKVLESHFVSNRYETGRKMIENFIEDFNSIKTGYSEP